MHVMSPPSRKLSDLIRGLSGFLPHRIVCLNGNQHEKYTFFTSTEIKSFCAYAGKDCLFKIGSNSGIIRVYKRKAKHIQQHESHKNN